MKTIKIFIVLAVAAISINVNSQTITSNDKPTFPPHEINQVQTDLINGMVSFVESVRPFYSKGDTYKEFRMKVLNGEAVRTSRTTLPITPPTLPAEGEAMLKKAFEYLSKQYSALQIAKIDNGKTIGEAALFVNKHNKSKSNSELNGNVVLFGGNINALDNNPITKASKGKCKWYQLSCHLDSIFGSSGGQQIMSVLVDLIVGILQGMM